MTKLWVQKCGGSIAITCERSRSPRVTIKSYWERFSSATTRSGRRPSELQSGSIEIYAPSTRTRTSDNVVRRLPLIFVVDGQPVPSLSVELAARALGASPHFGHDGNMTLAGYHIPTPTPNTLTLNFERGIDAIPTFSLADLDICLNKGRYGLLSPCFQRQSRDIRHSAGLRGSENHPEAICERPQRVAWPCVARCRPFRRIIRRFPAAPFPVLIFKRLRSTIL